MSAQHKWLITTCYGHSDSTRKTFQRLLDPILWELRSLHSSCCRALCALTTALIWQKLCDLLQASFLPSSPRFNRGAGTMSQKTTSHRDTAQLVSQREKGIHIPQLKEGSCSLNRKGTFVPLTRHSPVSLTRDKTARLPNRTLSLHLRQQQG